MQLVPAFLQLIQGILAAPRGVIQKGVGERIIFGGEDGFIIKENFEFVKNGKKDGQKGQGRIFVMLNIRNFGLTFQVEYGILQMLKRAERKLKL